MLFRILMTFTTLLYLLSMLSFGKSVEDLRFPLKIGKKWTFTAYDTLTYSETVLDTLQINNKTYYLFDNYRDISLDFFLRDDSGKIYIHSDTTEYLWYDFTANPGNWWITLAYPTYNWLSEFGLLSDSATVSTPLGDFSDCYHFCHYIASDLGYQEWFAPGVGKVKIAFIRVYGFDVWLLSDTSTVSTLPIDDDRVPNNFQLMQNYPNPFNSTTIISYSLTNSNHVTLTLYDIHGHVVSELVREYQQPGEYTVEFSGDGLSSGVYIYDMIIGKSKLSKKMLLVK